MVFLLFMSSESTSLDVHTVVLSPKKTPRTRNPHPADRSPYGVTILHSRKLRRCTLTTNLDAARSKARLLLASEKLRELPRFLETEIPALIAEVEELRLKASRAPKRLEVAHLSSPQPKPQVESSGLQRLLTVKEFAQTIAVTEACVRRWTMERKIQVVKLGRLVRIPRSEVERLIAQETVPVRFVERRR